LRRLQRRVINIEDAYTNSEFDFSGTRAFDEKTGYHRVRFLAVPLLNHENDVVGVLQLINARDPHPTKSSVFLNAQKHWSAALASYAAIALTNLSFWCRN
jgi:hypothetical protein